MRNDRRVNTDGLGGGWCAGACSVRGGSHARKAVACQDASVSCREGDWVFAAVADGHGGATHVRSAAGARMACEAAYDVLRGVRPRELTDDSVRALAGRILSRWDEQVMTDARLHPFVREELDALPEDARRAYIAGREIPRAYGTTLCAAIISGGSCLALRCGDGECVFLDADGTYGRPVPENPACVGSVTVSLCEEDAGAFCWYMGDAPAALFLTTDGLTNNALNREGLTQWYDRLLLACVGNGADEMLRGVRRDLESVAARGFGDDVSLAFAMDQDAASALEDTIRERARRCRQARAIAEKKKKIAVLESDIRWARLAVARRREEYERASSDDPGTRARLLEGIEQAENLLRESGAALAGLTGRGPEGEPTPEIKK